MSENSGAIDELALQEALIIRAPRLRKYLAMKIPTKLQSVVSADDILQEVWIAAFRGLPSFRADGKDAVDRWLTSIAHNRLVNAIKAAATAKRGGGYAILHDNHEYVSSMLGLFARVASDRRTPSSEAAVDEAVHAVQTALAALPEARRQAIGLRFLKGKSGEEIARTMNKTKPAVNSLLFHGLRQLREQLGSAAKFLSDAPSSEE